MQKKTSARIAGLFALAFAVLAAVADIDMMNVHAAENSETTDEINNYEYDDVNTLGAAVTIKSTILKVKKNDAAQTPKPSKVTVNGKTLKLNRDYTVLYQFLGDEYDEFHESWKTVENLTTPGIYRICLKGMGEYHGVYTRRIYVYDPKDRVPVSAFKVAVNKVPYTGKAIKNGVIKSIKYKNKELVEDKDYYVQYLNNVDSGTGIVRISAVEGSGFTGERDVKFSITGGTKISKAKITGITAKTYDFGNPVTQDMSQVKLTFKDKELVQGTDYVVSYYMNNTKAGTAKIVIAGKGGYYGTVTKSFKIGKVKLGADMLDEASKSIVEAYTKKAVKPEVTLYNSKGDRLVKGTDYTLSYKNNKKISDKAVIVVKGKGSYTGSFSVNFTITDKAIDKDNDEDEKSSEESTEGEKPSEGSSESGSAENEKPSEGSSESSESNESSESGESTDPSESTESGESESEEEPKEARPGSRVCYCGFTLDIRDFDNLTINEIQIWNEHAVTHSSTDKWTYTDKYSDGTEVEGTGAEKPIGFICCNCGYIMPTFIYGGSDEEWDAWKYHEIRDRENGRPTGYGSVTYEKALKLHRFTEDTVFIPCAFYILGEDGLYVLVEKYEDGCFVPVPSENDGSESGESTESSESSESGESTESSESSESGESAESGESESAGSESEEEPKETRPGTRVCHCGFTLDIRDFDNLTINEIQIWNDHAVTHSSTDKWTYTDKYSDGTDVEGTGAEKPIGFRCCNCGYIMPIFVNGLSDEEYDAWRAHDIRDRENGNPTGYGSVGYETALKLHRFTEDTVFIPCAFYILGEDGLYVLVEKYEDGCFVPVEN